MSSLLIPSRRRLRLSRFVTASFFAACLVVTNRWHQSTPLVSVLLSFVGWLLVAVGSIGRAWSGSYISGNKTVQLHVSGPYSICRNPLYLCSFFASMGAAMQTGTFTFPLLLAVSFLTYYGRVIRGEEQKLFGVHGENFTAYCQQVPRFWPSFKTFQEPAEYPVIAKSFRKELSDILLFIAAASLIQLVNALHVSKLITSYITLP